MRDSGGNHARYGQAPVVATLAAHGRAYTGVIGLPMFGDYRATLIVRTSVGRYTGAVALTVPST